MRLIDLFALVGLAVACSDSSGPASSSARYLAVVSGDSQNTSLMQRTPAPVVVRVTDEAGAPVSGVTVQFDLYAISMATGDSTRRLMAELGTRTTNRSGEASVHPTAPQYAARYAVIATVPNAPFIPPVRAIIRASASAPARIDIGGD